MCFLRAAVRGAVISEHCRAVHNTKYFMFGGVRLRSPRPAVGTSKKHSGGIRYSRHRLDNVALVRSSIDRIDRRWRNALAEYEMGVEGKARGVDALSGVLERQDAANNRRIIAGICQLVIGTG